MIAINDFPSVAGLVSSFQDLESSSPSPPGNATREAGCHDVSKSGTRGEELKSDGSWNEGFMLLVKLQRNKRRNFSSSRKAADCGRVETNRLNSSTQRHSSLRSRQFSYP